MKKFVLFTDTDCDIDIETAKKYDLKLISMPYVVDGKEIYPYEDFEVFKSHEFYEELRKGLLPTTCGIDPIKYRSYFEPYLKEGYDILYIHFSSAMTGTFNSMRIAIDDLKEDYPNCNIYTADTKGITIISYSMVIQASKMYKEGKSLEEIKSFIETEADHFAQYFYADSLKFFARSGRVTGIAAVMGSMIGIKPIIYMSQDGKMESISKARGRKNAVNAILEYVENLQDNIEKYPVIIGHTDALELAKELEAKLQEKYNNKLDIEIICTNPTAGSHCGPDGVGVCFHSKSR